MLMVLRTSLVVLAVAVALISGSAIADSTWTGGGDGTSWSDAANWDSGVPVNGYANIGNTATDRVIVMDQVGNKAAVNWTQTDDASNTIRVDTDWTQCCYNAAWTWDNSGGRIGYDLNGNTLETLDGGGAKLLRNFDLEGPGTWHVNRKFDFGAGAQIGAGVTVRSSWAGGNFSGGNEPWDPTATLLIDDGGGGTWTGGGTIGNLKVNAGKDFGNNGTMNVQGNVTIEGNMAMHGGLTQQFRAAGNVSVLGAGNMGNSGKLVLNGASGTVQQLDIQNPITLAVRFEGQPADTGVKAQLLHDLDASAATNVNPHESMITGDYGNIDLNGHDASFNRLVMVAPEITWGVGAAEQSVINIGDHGAHFIGSTDVTIKNLGGWAGGDLTLFNVDPAAVVQGGFGLGTLTLPGSWTSDGIAIEGKNVVLKNVGVPEPTSLVLLAVGLLGAWIRRR